MMNCILFDDYKNKEYKIITEHKVFGKNIITGEINGLIDDNDRVGVIVHGKEIFCTGHNVKEENGIVYLSDSLMKITIK